MLEYVQGFVRDWCLFGFVLLLQVWFEDRSVELTAKRNESVFGGRGAVHRPHQIDDWSRIMELIVSPWHVQPGKPSESRKIHC